MTIAPWYPWTGRPVEPAISVIDVTGEVTEEAYTVSYERNISFGKGRVIVQDIEGGNYEVSGTVEFYIVPGPVLCIAYLMFLWSMTTGVAIKKSKKAVQSEKP